MAQVGVHTVLSPHRLAELPGSRTLARAREARRQGGVDSRTHSKHHGQAGDMHMAGSKPHSKPRGCRTRVLCALGARDAWVFDFGLTVYWSARVQACGARSSPLSQFS